MPAFRGTLKEAFALLRHFLKLLLAHGPAKNVGVTQGVTREFARDLHDLFLVKDDAVGLAEDFLEFGEVPLDGFAAVLALDEIVEHATLYGAGTIEGVQRGQVFDAGGLVAAQDVAHSRRFELEHA